MNTLGPLSRACMGPILNMIRRVPSVSKNLLFGLYAEVCGMGLILMYTNRTSLNNIIITCYCYLTSDILDLYLRDLWHNTLSCPSPTYDICATVLNPLTLLFLGFHFDSMIFICVTGHCLYLYAWTTLLNHVHVWLAEHANWLYLTYSLGYFLTTLDPHIQVQEPGLWWPCCS